MMRRIRVAACLSCVIVFGACGRQTDRADSGGGSGSGNQTTPLFDDLGSHHHAVTTSNALAQKYFDQGLRLVYGFNHDEAERAFRQAARLDPESAMAWWGVSYALGPNYNLPMDADHNVKAVAALRAAQERVGKASEPERAYIAALATRYSSSGAPDRAALDRAYSNAMRALHERYPDDNDAAVLYAESLMDLKPWQLWTHDGMPAQETIEIVNILEGVLARDPNHPGANHYYIHAIEASPHPEKGVASAERLRTAVPGAGHLVHMPAHIFIRTGNYQGAIDANARAVRADEVYFGRTKTEGMYPLMYYTHNFQFLATAAGMLGQSATAIDAAARAVKNVTPMAHDPMMEYVLPWSLYMFARSEKWDEILRYPRPAEATPVTLAMWHYVSGLAHVGLGDLAAARSDRRALDLFAAKVPDTMLLNTNRARDLLALAASVLDARLAEAGRDSKSAIKKWTEAVRIQDDLVYDEPPAWYYPVRESLGGAYLRARQYAEAEKVFRRDLELTPNNPRSLFGLSEALRRQSKQDEAQAARQRFDEAWKHADIELTIRAL